MSDLPKPSIAVALSYEHGGVPKLVAKGQGEVADKIIETAREHGVIVEQNPVLAEALSKVELEQHIPVDLYKAVAKVIGFVLRASGKMK